MVGVLLTLVAIGLVSYFVIKNYYPPIILLLLGLLLLFCAYLEGVPAVAPKASTNFPKLPRNSSVLTFSLSGFAGICC